MERKRLTIEQFLRLNAMMEDEEHKERLATEAASAKMIEASRALEASMAAAGGAGGGGGGGGKGLGALKLGWGRARGSLAGAIAKAAAPLEAPAAPSANLVSRAARLGAVGEGAAGEGSRPAAAMAAGSEGASASGASVSWAADGKAADGGEEDPEDLMKEFGF